MKRQDIISLNGECTVGIRKDVKVIAKSRVNLEFIKTALRQIIQWEETNNNISIIEIGISKPVEKGQKEYGFLVLTPECTGISVLVAPIIKDKAKK